MNLTKIKTSIFVVPTWQEYQNLMSDLRRYRKDGVL